MKDLHQWNIKSNLSLDFKIIKVDGVGDVFAVKLTPEMLLPHKTHRKKGGMVYTPEIIDIFEAA